MYLDTIDDHANYLDMGSVVLAALHRSWRRQEPRRRQRLCRQSLKRRQLQQRDRQAGTGETAEAVTFETAGPPRQLHPLNRVLAAAAKSRGLSEGGGGPAAATPMPVLTAAVADLLEMCGEPRQSPVRQTAGGAVQVVCPRPGCLTLCRASQPAARCRHSGAEPQHPPGVPPEFLATDSRGGGGGGGLEALRCSTCHWCVAVRVGGVWTPLEVLLRDTQSRGSGWHRVTSLADRAALYLLVVYIYGERERSAAAREPELRPPPPGDSALLLFAENGAAVGFATLKRRGQLLREHAGPEQFQMDILDTVFVRQAVRRGGRAGELLERLARGAARIRRRLGVTRPTPAMRRLLHAFLAGRPWARGLLFEVTWAAGVNNRTNIWEQMVADGGVEGPEWAATPPRCA